MPLPVDRPSVLARPEANPTGPVLAVGSRRQAVIAIVFVSVVAVLFASFPARNSDLLAHLAAGRELARGAAAAGPTWLYDLVVYGVYAAFGGIGLGFLKAVAVASVAVILFRLGRVGAGVWLPAACVALALLVIAARLLLQPALASYVMLALTLLLLFRRDNARVGWLPPWPLLLVFVAWANLDGRFVYGLGVVALVWLGRILDGGVSNAARYSFALVLLAAVCLVNPSHVAAFRLPPEIGLLIGGVRSPFSREYFTSAALSPAGLAYFPLLGLSLLSFFLNRSDWRFERFLPWLGLAALSAAQVRAVPFFAVVAGPVLAWNLQELVTRRPASARAVRWGQVPGLITGGVLLACAWPGWLQSPPYEPRRWGVEMPPSLEHGAAAVCREYAGPDLPDARYLFLSPDAAAAFAWYCPQATGVVDDLLAAAFVGDPGVPDDWADRMRAAGITRVVVYHPDRGRHFDALARLSADPDRWPLLHLEGDLAVFGWREPARPGMVAQFRGREFDAARRAFADDVAEKAPPAGPAAAAVPRRWWEAFWKPAPRRSIDRDAAAAYLLLAEVALRSAPYRHMEAWEAGQAAALVGAASVPNGLVGVPARLTVLRPPIAEGPGADRPPPLVRMTLATQQLFVRRRDDAPPALVYLAIRAARRAVAANPDDAQAYLLLGEAYVRLIEQTRERSWVRLVPELSHLRAAQATTALARAVALDPALAEGHRLLGNLYRQTETFDLALAHLRTYHQLVREAGPPPGMTADAFRDQRDAADRELDRFARSVADRETKYAAAATADRVLDRAQAAAGLGLSGRARDMLLASDVSAFGPKGMELELELLLRTGQADKVRDWLLPEHAGVLGEATYRWMRVLARASTGDYAAAGDEFAAVVAARERPAGFRDVLALSVGQAVLDGGPAVGGWPEFGGRVAREDAHRKAVSGVTFAMRQAAEVTVIRGLLALEAGDIGTARVAFRAALSGAEGGVDFAGRVIAQDCLDWFK